MNKYLIKIFSHRGRMLVLFFLGDMLNAFSQDTYEVYALKFAERAGKLSISSVAIGASGNDSVGVCYMIWLLKGKNGRTVLVDAGFADTSGIPGMKFTRPDSMLMKIDVNPDDITDIVLTHPHWDHIGGLDLFPKATVWMQNDDYDYFVGAAWQKDGNANAFNKDDVLKIVRRNLEGKLMLVHGDNKEIIPGIKVFIGSKHTCESQFALVNTGTDKVIIASDNSWFYYNLVHLLPIPVTMDARAYVKNLKRMKKIVKNIDLIIPGHDPTVFLKFEMIKEGIVKIRG